MQDSEEKRTSVPAAARARVLGRSGQLWAYWSVVALLLAPSYLMAAHNTGAEPFVEFRVFDAWVLGFLPGAVAMCWVAVAALGIRMRRRSAVAATVGCAISLVGLAVVLYIPAVYFGDLAKFISAPPP